VFTTSSRILSGESVTPVNGQENRLILISLGGDKNTLATGEAKISEGVGDTIRRTTTNSKRHSLSNASIAGISASVKRTKIPLRTPVLTLTVTNSEGMMLTTLERDGAGLRDFAGLGDATILKGSSPINIRKKIVSSGSSFSMLLVTITRNSARPIEGSDTTRVTLSPGIADDNNIILRLVGHSN